VPAAKAVNGIAAKKRAKPRTNSPLTYASSPPQYARMNDNLTTKPTLETLLEMMRDLRDTMNARFDDVNKRLDAVDARFDSVDARFDAMNERLDSVDERLDVMNGRFDVVNERLSTVNGRFSELETRTDRTDSLVHKSTSPARSSKLKRSTTAPSRPGLAASHFPFAIPGRR
jgi:tetrahydromethanopterin S-methyltransferase subunit G